MDEPQDELTEISNALASQTDDGFENVEQIGQGAFGIVVRAKCVKDGKIYAIKIMPFTQDRVKYQERELRLLITLNHPQLSPNVIKYYGGWFIKPTGYGKQLCIQMESCLTDLCKFVYNNEMGGPEIIKAQQQGQPRFYQHVFRQILDGIAAIHSLRWVHRDIHPGNILIACPSPQQISDIVIKIADFGLARHVRVKLETTIGLTIIPLEEVSYFSRNGHFRAPELSTKTYDFKVDLYSAGMVLYFISRYLEDVSKWERELQALKRGNLNINESVYHKDDEILCTLIQNLLEEDPKTRLSAVEAKEYIFPTQAKDSTDASKPLKVQFFARKDGEENLRRCSLSTLTLSALVDATRSKIGEFEEIWQECVVNKEKKRVEIDCDEDVENMFIDAASGAESRRDVEVVVRVKPPEDSDAETKQPERKKFKKEKSSQCA